MVEQRGLDFISKKKQQKKKLYSQVALNFLLRCMATTYILHPLKAGVLPQLYAKGFYAMLKNASSLVRCFLAACAAC